MSVRYDEIGNRLRAFRLGTNLSVEEIALRLGISRTALYRFENGELVKIETLARLAELLGVSIATLLGVGIEYISSAVSYFERIRQIELTAEHIHVLAAPLPSLLASDHFLAALPEVLIESVSDGTPNRARTLEDVSKLMEILHERRQVYLQRRPTIVSLISEPEIDRFLHYGVVGCSRLPARLVEKRRAIARAEVEHLATLIQEQPIGVQMGLLMESLPHSGFHIFRQPNQKMLALSPFRLVPNVRAGVAMITGAPEALALHERMVNEMWKRALKGPTAANYLRRLIAAQDPTATRLTVTTRAPRAARPGRKTRRR
jgi:transcriptional regulator with XRE-family HTH domain